MSKASGDNFKPRALNQTICSITIAWNEFPDAEVYKVEQKHKMDKWQRVYWGSMPTAKIEHLDENLCYSFRIVAMKLTKEVDDDNDGGYKILATSNLFRVHTLALLPSTMSLYRSIRKGEQYLVKRLLLANPNLVNTPSSNGYSPLANAIIHGEKDIVDILLTAGASVHVGNQVNKRTPLHLSFYYGQILVSKMLINKKADINAVDCINMTPCHYAVDGGQFEILKFALEENKCNIEWKDDCGWTLFQRAVAMKASLDILKLLWGFGCQTDVKDKNGHTCLELAIINKQNEVINFLTSIAK